MKEYIIRGQIRLGAFTYPFTRQVTANTRKYAEELTYAFFGSKHHLKRCFIKIEEVKTKDETKEKGD